MRGGKGEGDDMCLAGQTNDHQRDKIKGKKGLTLLSIYIHKPTLAKRV